MLKHIIQFSIAFSVLFFVSCSQNEETENQQNQENQLSVGTSTLDDGPIEDIPYPSIFTDKQVPLIDGAYLINKKELKNTKNMVGMQIAEKSDKSYDDVIAYYLENLEKNGWERKTDADQKSTPEQENDETPVKYFVTKFLKDVPEENKKYVLLINIASMDRGKTTITKIIKEM